MDPNKQFLWPWHYQVVDKENPWLIYAVIQIYTDSVTNRKDTEVDAETDISTYPPQHQSSSLILMTVRLTTLAYLTILELYL